MGVLDDINPLKDDGPVADMGEHRTAAERLEDVGTLGRGSDELDDDRGDTETQGQEQNQI